MFHCQVNNIFVQSGMSYQLLFYIQLDFLIPGGKTLF